jgi:hypothetical protein
VTEPTVGPGEMRLYDDVRPALPDDLYSLTASTTLSRSDFGVGTVDAFFSFDGPRFALPATEVVAVHPPRNAQGPFHEVFPHVVLGRRTLPWERALDSDGVIPAPVRDAPDPEPRPLTGDTPWLALLLFVDDPTRREVTVLPRPVALSSVVTDPAIRARLRLGGADPGVEAIEVDARLLRQLMPSKEEVQLLCHARQVNVDDRELAAGDSDGWFAIVTANRLPTPGLRHRACLVSLEQRSDVVFPAAPQPGEALPAPGPKRLVLLHTWSFTAAPARPGGGSFRELAEALDHGLFGVGTAGVTDTGHRALTLDDRTGNEQTVWYRGPLVARPVERDPLGPYHSADQARRISPETGAEDISYAAAFDLGRLLGAADGRLAEDLMAWRREAYRVAARRSVAEVVWTDVPAMASTPAEGVASGMVTQVSLTMFERAGSGAGEAADVNLAQAVRSAPGLDPIRLAAAWNLTAPDAHQLLAAAAPGQRPAPPAAAPGPPAPVSAAEELQAARSRLLGAPPRPPESPEAAR